MCCRMDEYIFIYRNGDKTENGETFARLIVKPLILASNTLVYYSCGDKSEK